jgi:hypothetical protein
MSNVLPHYVLPETLRIELQDKEGKFFTRFPVAVMVRYGYQLPPLLSDSSGKILVTREMLLKVERDEISSDIMGKQDYSTNRYMFVEILSQKDASVLSKKRMNSGWPIQDFEKELYGDMRALLAAFNQKEDIRPVKEVVDLSLNQNQLEIILTVVTHS